MSVGSHDNERLAELQESVSQRARAAEAGAGALGSTMDPYLAVRAGPRWLALPATAIREVVLKGSLTRVPLSSPHVLGVAVIRGRVVPVITLEGWLGVADLSELVPTLPRLVIVETAAAEIAVVVDEVRGITELPNSGLRDEAPVAGRPGWIAAELTWDKQLLCVVDVQRLVETAMDEEQKA
jgi:chemotaxis signal transduction protein